MQESTTLLLLCFLSSSSVDSPFPNTVANSSTNTTATHSNTARHHRPKPAPNIELEGSSLDDTDAGGLVVCLRLPLLRERERGTQMENEPKSSLKASPAPATKKNIQELTLPTAEGLIFLLARGGRNKS